MNRIRSRRLPETLLFFALICVFYPQGWGQEKVGQNPYSSAGDRAAGGVIFRAQCALCHATDGTGELGPDLTRARYRHGNSDADLFRIVSMGVPGTRMDPSRLSERQAWQVVAYVRTLSAQASDKDLPGQPAEGNKLFWGPAGCSNCHMVGGQGGRLGPELSDIGWKRSPRYLRDFIRSPTSRPGSDSQIFVDLYRRYWPVTVTDRSGRVVDGVLLTEDTYSIQLMDRSEGLHSFRKQDVQEIRRGERSAMPSYQDSLTGKQLDDLVAYLNSLRGE